MDIKKGLRYGKKTAAKLKARDPDHFKKIGALGGKKSRGGGFTKETAKKWGALGGKISKRKRTED